MNWRWQRFKVGFNRVMSAVIVILIFGSFVGTCVSGKPLDIRKYNLRGFP